MLIRGNSKLGSVFHFSLKAGHTCPGESDVCKDDCYAKKGHFNQTSVKLSHSRAKRASLRADFATKMIAYINTFGIEVVRIHSSGDFYSTNYVKKWRRIIASCPQTQFYAYTRSWRNIPRISPALRRAVRSLSRYENMTLWLSCDKRTGRPPMWAGVPWAYLAVDDDDIPDYYDPTLVFRKVRKTLMRRQPRTNSLVCPVEQGADLEITCSTCRLCYNKSGKVLKEIFEIALS